MKKIVLLSCLLLIICLLPGCSEKPSSEFDLSLERFEKDLIGAKDLKSLASNPLSASKSLDLEIVNKWYADIEKSEKIAELELKKGIYKSVMIAARLAENRKVHKAPAGDIENVQTHSSDNAKIYYVLVTQEAAASQLFQ